MPRGDSIRSGSMPLISKGNIAVGRLADAIELGAYVTWDRDRYALIGRSLEMNTIAGIF